jgi:hypothetical protein
VRGFMAGAMKKVGHCRVCSPACLEQAASRRQSPRRGGKTATISNENRVSAFGGILRRLN